MFMERQHIRKCNQFQNKLLVILRKPRCALVLKLAVFSIEFGVSGGLLSNSFLARLTQRHLTFHNLISSTACNFFKNIKEKINPFHFPTFL